MKKIMAIAFLIALGACKKDDNEVNTPTPTNEEELITTVTLHFTEVADTLNNFMVSFKDIDGVGGNDAIIDTIKLGENKTFNVTIELLDESSSPVKNITEEVKEEADEHLFCYTIFTSELRVNNIDSDGNFPIGIESEWVSGYDEISSIKIFLKHQPDGQKDGSCYPGETDVEVVFPLVIQ